MKKCLFTRGSKPVLEELDEIGGDTRKAEEARNPLSEGSTMILFHIFKSSDLLRWDLIKDGVLTLFNSKRVMHRVTALITFCQGKTKWFRYNF